MKKTNYETPQAELFVVRFEEGFLTNSITTVPGAPSKNELYYDLNDGEDY